MGRAVLQDLAQIVPPPDYFPVKHHYGANGHFTQGVSFRGLRQGFTHVSGLVHNISPSNNNNDTPGFDHKSPDNTGLFWR
jgi:hypothetical protein